MGLRSRKRGAAACAFAVLFFWPPCILPQSSVTETQKLSSATLPKFLNEYARTVGSVAEAFNQLDKEKLPLFDQSGHALGRRTIKDRSKELVEIRSDLDRLAAKPDDLVFTMKLLNHTERLADDVYDVSQIAYDNDREELGKQLTDLLSRLDRDQDQMEAYALTLAAEEQDRIQAVEQENRHLKAESKKSTNGTQADPVRPSRSAPRQ
jgi:hypothetical protein